MPTTFMDGPAAGQGMSLHRAPWLLRLVVDERGRWDALDQLADEPRAGESVHVYRLAVDHGPVHVCIRGAGRAGSGWYRTAIYRQHDRQPDAATALDTDLWREWVTREFGRVFGERAPAPLPEVAG